MPQPVLDVGDVGTPVQRRGGGRGAQRMRGQALEVDAGQLGVAYHDVLVDRSGGQGFVQIAAVVVPDRAE